MTSAHEVVTFRKIVHRTSVPLAGTSAFLVQETFLWRRSGIPKSAHDADTAANDGARAVADSTTEDGGGGGSAIEMCPNHGSDSDDLNLLANYNGSWVIPRNID